LVGELARWRKHESLRPATDVCAGVADALHAGKHVPKRLTTAGFSNANKVATRLCNRPALSLDGRGLAEAGALDAFEDVGWEASILEVADGIRDVLALDKHLMASAVLFGRLAATGELWWAHEVWHLSFTLIVASRLGALVGGLVGGTVPVVPAVVACNCGRAEDL